MVKYGLSISIGYIAFSQVLLADLMIILTLFDRLFNGTKTDFASVILTKEPILSQDDLLELSSEQNSCSGSHRAEG